MKKLIRRKYTMLLTLCLLSLYGTSYGQKFVTYKMEGSPYTDIYVRDFKHNSFVIEIEWEYLYKEKIQAEKKPMSFLYKPWWLGSTDSLGKANITIPSNVFKIYKNDIIAVKSGYEPQVLKLNAKNNNDIHFLKESALTAADYWDMAIAAEKESEQLKYYQNVIYQDYRNDVGLKARAFLNMGIIYHNKGNLNQALCYFLEAKKLDPDCGVEEALVVLNNDIAASNYKIELKREKAEQRNEIVKSVASATLVATSTTQAILEQKEARTQSTNSDSNSSGSTNNGGTTKNTNSSHTTNPKNCADLQKAYSGHTSTIQKIFNEWDSDMQYDIKHNQYNRTNGNRDLLRENLRDIESLKESVSRMGCSVQYNSFIEAEAQKKVNFSPNW